LLGVELGMRSLVFTRTKYGADKVVRQLKRDGIHAEAMHGDKSQSIRTRTLDAYRARELRVLVATDVAARGIDVDGIDMVLNFDVPADPEIYVHRVGRTARAGHQGLAVTLVSPHEWLLMGDIEKLIGRTFPREIVPGFEPSIPPLEPKVMSDARPKPKNPIRPRAGRARSRR
ncbi:MAG: helicase-related protein, partial [Gemmatimonadales bacterium]